MSQLTPIDHNGLRVLTTANLADSFEADRQQISKNYNRNTERYIEGKHYFMLQGEAKTEFLNRVQIDDGSKNAAFLYLWTEKGAWLHAKSLNTDRAWEAYEALVDDYYTVKESRQTIPQSLPEALRLAADLAEKNELLQLQAEANRPKVIFAEALEVSEDSILVADLAKLLKQNGIEFGEVRLFKWLRNNGFLIKSGSEYNLPTQRSMELGIMEIKVGQRGSASEGIKMTRTPKVTGKGQIYFINKFKKEKSPCLNHFN